jgi:hypothetical protein
MEGPGIISNLMEKSTAENHPGTMNFPYRLANARKIHQENLAMASRLDSIKAYYDSKTLAAMTKEQKKLSPKKLKLTSRHNKSTNENGRTFDQHGRVVLGKNALHINQSATYDSPDPYSTSVGGGSGGNGSKRGRNVLLEYTKIQKGRVLDVAVIKEPFRDNYCIFGIDIDNGQRYELKLSSEEVSNILEGDILVTSVDNVEVWMTLLTKVELYPVEAFAKIPLPSQPQRAFSSSNQYDRHGATGASTTAAAPEFHEDMEDHTFSSIHLEDETLNPQLHCEKSSTPVVRLPTKPPISSFVPQTEFPHLDDHHSHPMKGGGSSGHDYGSYASLETTNTDLDAVGHGINQRVGENDSASILTAGVGDHDDSNGYTLDEYYDSNIHLTPLPLSESTNAIKEGEGEEGEQVMVKDPYYDQIDAATLLQNRPSARSTSRDQQSQRSSSPVPVPAPPLSQLSQGLPHLLPSTQSSMEQKNEQQKEQQEQQKKKILTQLAQTTMKSIMNSVLDELQKKIPRKTEITKTEKSKKDPSSEISNHSSSPDRKKSVAGTKSNQIDPKKRMSVSNVPSTSKSNPYRSTKVSTAGRSHSIRYTSDEAQHVVTSSNVVTTPLQPVPPSDHPSTKQQTTIRKQSVRKQSSIPATDRETKGSSVVPNKPQESMPSARRPSKQTPATSVTAGTKNSNEGNNRKMSKISPPPVEKTESDSQFSLKNCEALAQSTAVSAVEMAQLNIQKILQQIPK